MGTDTVVTAIYSLTPIHSGNGRYSHLKVHIGPLQAVTGRYGKHNLLAINGKAQLWYLRRAQQDCNKLIPLHCDRDYYDDRDRLKTTEKKETCWALLASWTITSSILYTGKCLCWRFSFLHHAVLWHSRWGSSLETTIAPGSFLPELLNPHSNFLSCRLFISSLWVTPKESFPMLITFGRLNTVLNTVPTAFATSNNNLSRTGTSSPSIAISTSSTGWIPYFHLKAPSRRGSINTTRTYIRVIKTKEKCRRRAGPDFMAWTLTFSSLRLSSLRYAFSENLSSWDCWYPLC